MSKTKEKWVLMGQVGVDSGTLMIGDPCYLDDKEDWNPELYQKWICEKLGNDRKKDYIQIEEMCFAQAVAFGSGFGDGIYDVFGLIKDYGKLGERIKEVRIILIKD